MAVETARYIRKPLYVDAVRITVANFDDVSSWCEGEVLQDEVPGKGTTKRYIKVEVHNPKNVRQTKAFVGDWLLYTERGYKVYTNKAFHESFDIVDEGTPANLEAAKHGGAYPRDEGDVTVIGPECFAQPDGSVLCWKGVNYTPQTVDEGTPANLEAAKYGIVPGGAQELAPGITLTQGIQELHPVDLSVLDQIRQLQNVGYSEEQIAEELKLAPEVIRVIESNGRIPQAPAIPRSEVKNVEDVPNQETIVPAAAEGRRVLSIAEQQKLTAQEVRELVQAGEVVLAQDIPEA